MRVPRTFVFVDLSGFTNYTAAFGDDAAGRLLSTFRAIVRDTASERGVRIGGVGSGAHGRHRFGSERGASRGTGARWRAST